MTRENQWVDFDDPPVTEVVVAVAFRPVEALTVAHMGLFWHKHLAGQFPHVEERSPYDPPVERFDGPSASGLALSLESGPPLPRLWFRTDDEQELIQLQQDWFACNWRKVSPEDEYGRWPSRRDAFERWFTSFTEFLQQDNLGQVRPVQCEVTYVNHIGPASEWERHGQLDRVLTTVGRAERFLPEPEEIRIRSKYLMTLDETPIGRLHVQCDPVVSRKDGTPAFALNLTARGRPQGESLDDILDFMDLGREWVTRGFESLTTASMQQAWGRNVE